MNYEEVWYDIQTKSKWNCYWLFSTSLLIYKNKKEKITTVEAVWIPGLISIDIDDFTSPFNPQFLLWFRRYIKHERQCFNDYPNTSNFVQKTPLCISFSTLFSVFGYLNETLSLVFGILLELLQLCRLNRGVKFFFVCEIERYIQGIKPTRRNPIIKRTWLGINKSLTEAESKSTAWKPAT